jgi:predicted GTPase
MILWDGGNNDFSFIKSDLEIVVLDPHRPGHESRYHPGETNFLRARILVANKVDTARKEDVEALRQSAGARTPRAAFVQTASRIRVEQEERIRGKRVLVIEDGPTVTHGEMAYGAGYLAAQQYGAAECVDPRPYAAKSLQTIFANYPHLKKVLPAEGYFPEQLQDLEATIRQVPCDLVLIATPIDLSRLIKIQQPSLRVTYRVEDSGEPRLSGLIKGFLREKNLIE